VERVEVAGITFDAVNKAPVVVLRDMARKRMLPIWIGPNEANAIMTEMQGVRFTRPMTHDLIKLIIGSLGGEVVQVVVNNVKDGTYFAEIQISLDGVNTLIDSRPSDAIAVALRVDCPIFVSDTILSCDQWLEEEKMKDEEKEKQFKRFISELKPEDFY